MPRFRFDVEGPAGVHHQLVAVSGYSTERDVQLGREVGFDAHLSKPVDLADIEKLLDAWKGSDERGPGG